MAKFGFEWLGSDSEAGHILDAPTPYVEEPRRYGFHATLKAPMRLDKDVNYDHFRTSVKKLASGLEIVELGVLKPAQIGKFLALKTDNINHAVVAALAWKCTRELDIFRAPLSDGERHKRPNLNLSEQSNLEQWGYPYVGNSFRFHMTLTSHLSQTDLDSASKLLISKVPKETTILSSISIFGDPGVSKPFEFVERFDLQG